MVAFIKVFKVNCFVLCMNSIVHINDYICLRFKVGRYAASVHEISARICAVVSLDPDTEPR